MDPSQIKKWYREGVVKRRAKLKELNRPSHYVQPFDKIEPGDRVVIRPRVSKKDQEATGNLKDQKNRLRRMAEAKGAVVVGVKSYVGKASGEKHDASLYEAARFAASLGAKLLAESTSRYVRHPNFRKKYQPDFNGKVRKGRRRPMPTFLHLQDLPWICGAVPLVTLYEPDLEPDDETGFQTQRGMTEKNRKGGRPPKKEPGYKKRHREKNMPEVWRLRGEGMSNRAIGRKLCIPESTIRLWLDRSL